MLRKSMRITEKDTVAVVLEDAMAHDVIEIDSEEIELVEDVEFAHKVALKDYKMGEPVIKYGEEIGYALVDIPKGAWIHNHNMGCDRGKKVR